MSSRQPLAALIRALMEPDSPMPEEFLRRQRWLLEQQRQLEFSDITAWSIPLAYNLEAWTVDGPITVATAAPVRGLLTGEGKLGYLAAPQGLAGFRLAAALMAAELRFRVAVQPFANGDRDYPAGTMFVPRVGNPERPRVAADGTGGSARRVAATAADRLASVRGPRWVRIRWCRCDHRGWRWSVAAASAPPPTAPSGTSSTATWNFRTTAWRSALSTGWIFRSSTC